MSYNSNYNWDMYQFRSSCITKIMAGCSEPGHTEAQAKKYTELVEKQSTPKGLTAIQTATLIELEEKLNTTLQVSSGTKTILDEIWHDQVCGRKKLLIGECFTKGTLREVEAIEYANKVKGTNYKKWEGGKLGLPDAAEVMFSQVPKSLINGEPDIVTDNFIIDIKCSWDYFSHLNKSEGYFASQYYYQLLAYMHLTGTRQAFIVNVLLSQEPEYIIKEQRKLETHFEYEKLAAQIVANSIYDDLPDDFRVKIYEYEYNDKRAELMFEYLALCKEYLKSKKL